MADKRVEDMLFIATIEFVATLFPEDIQAFQLSLEKEGYILHQDKGTSDYEVYKEEDA